MSIEPRSSIFLMLVGGFLRFVLVVVVACLGALLGYGFREGAHEWLKHPETSVILPFLAMALDLGLWGWGSNLSQVLLFNEALRWRQVFPVTPRAVVHHGIFFRPEWSSRAASVLFFGLACAVIIIVEGKAQGSILRIESFLFASAFLSMIVMMLTANFGELWHGRHRAPVYLIRHALRFLWMALTRVLGRLPSCGLVILLGVAAFMAGGERIRLLIAIPSEWIAHAPPVTNFIVYLFCPIWGLALAFAKESDPIILGAITLFNCAIILRSTLAFKAIYSRECYDEYAIPNEEEAAPTPVSIGSDELRENEIVTPVFSRIDEEDEFDDSTEEAHAASVAQTWKQRLDELKAPAESGFFARLSWRKMRERAFRDRAKELSVSSLPALDREGGKPRMLSFGTKHQPLLYDPTLDPLDQLLRHNQHNPLEPRFLKKTWVRFYDERWSEFLGCLFLPILLFFFVFYLRPTVAFFVAPIVLRLIALGSLSEADPRSGEWSKLALPLRFGNFIGHKLRKQQLSLEYHKALTAFLFFLLSGFNLFVFVYSLATFMIAKPYAWRWQMIANAGSAGHRASSWISQLLTTTHVLGFLAIWGWLVFFMGGFWGFNRGGTASMFASRVSSGLEWVFLFELCLHFVLACAAVAFLRLRTRVMDDSVMMEGTK